MPALTLVASYIILGVLLLGWGELARLYLNRRYLLKQEPVLLELTPPLTSLKTPLATEELFQLLHQLGQDSSFVGRLLGRSGVFSLEIVSTRPSGIKFVARVAAKDVRAFRQQLASYHPGLRFRIIKDYLPTLDLESCQLSEYKQTRHFAYPLSARSNLVEHDPIAYITGSMTKLGEDELVVLQLVITPVLPRAALHIRAKLMKAEDPKLENKHRAWLLRAAEAIIQLFIGLLEAVLQVTSELTKAGHLPPGKRPRAIVDQAAALESRRVFTSMENKLTQPLFKVSLRTMVTAQDKDRLEKINAGLDSALQAYSVHGFQGLRLRGSLIPFARAAAITNFAHRTPGLWPARANILSLSELASLYHFPYGQAAVTENLSRSLSRTLPAPAVMKARADTNYFDVILGENRHHGSISPVGLTEKERQRHIYILGGTGNGKTTMLLYAIAQDIKANKGVAVIDPHGDLAETILKYIPEDRLKDVIYFNPADLSYPLGLNLLELPKHLDGDELLLEQDFITESVVSLFRKIFSGEDSGGHRIEYILRNALHTAFTTKKPTLFTVYRLLTDDDYREEVTDKLKDPDLQSFWQGEFAHAGDMQRVKMSAGVTSKLGRFLRSASARRVLEQTRSTIDFDAILEGRKILICNFSKGRIGEDTSALFGISVLTKLQLAAYRRQRLAPELRTPFYLYVDEFQNFATSSFSQLLSEARKYRLFMTLAEQSPSQQRDNRMTNIILANVGTIVAFRSGSPSDEQLVLPLFSPHIDQGELLNLSAYNFYMKLSATQAYEPLSGVTRLLEGSGSEKMAQRVISASRRRYGRRHPSLKPKQPKKPRPAIKVSKAVFTPLKQPL